MSETSAQVRTGRDHRFDPVDQVLVEMLRQDGRASFGDLAKEVRLTPEAVRQRIGRLVGEGIMRIVGVVDPLSIGYHALGSAWFTYDGDIAHLATRLSERQQVTYMAEVLGAANIYCRFAAVDEVGLSDLVRAIIAENPGLILQDFSYSLKFYKWLSQGVAHFAAGDGGALAQLPVVADDEFDLMRLLVQNPRESLRNLAEALGTPYWTVRRKVQRLFADGVITPTAIVDRLALDDALLGNILVRLSGPVEETMAEVATSADVATLTLHTGAYNASVEFVSPTRAHLTRLVQQVMGLSGVIDVSVRMYVHTHVVARAWHLDRYNLLP